MGLVKILFLSDTHLGFDFPFATLGLNAAAAELIFSPMWIARSSPARKGEVDCVVHGGDLLYRSKVPGPAVALAAEPLKDGADAGVPVFLVPGNHERSIIPHFERMHHPISLSFDRPRTFVLEVGGLQLALAGFPFFGEMSAVLLAGYWRPLDGKAILPMPRFCVSTRAWMGPRSDRRTICSAITPMSSMRLEYRRICGGAGRAYPPAPGADRGLGPAVGWVRQSFFPGLSNAHPLLKKTKKKAI